jgi:hypothetical protein
MLTLDTDQLSGARPRRTPVWRRITPSSDVVGSLVPSSDHAAAARSVQHSSPPADGDGAAADSQGHRGRKRRRRSRRHRNPAANVPDHQASSSEEERDEPRPDAQVAVPLQGTESGPVPPICAVNFTEGFAREELELRRHSLFVSVFGTRPVVLADKVVTEVAHSFQLDGSLLKIHHSMHQRRSRVPCHHCGLIESSNSTAIPLH